MIKSEEIESLKQGSANNVFFGKEMEMEIEEIEIYSSTF